MGTKKTTTTSTNNGSTSVTGIGPQDFFMQCWGLKPNTIHYAFLVDFDVTSDCVPKKDSLGGVSGTVLKSDSTGFMQFTYYFKPNNSPYTWSYLEAHGTYIATIPAGNQKFLISSMDGTSKVEGFIESKTTT
jgi:hypothetical protein